MTIKLPDEKINYFAALTGMPRPHELVPFPRKVNGGQEFMIGMVMLTAYEDTEVKVYAEKQAQKSLKEAVGKNKGYDELYNDFACAALLWIACRLENDINVKFFPSKEDILNILTSTEIGVLMNHYYTLQLHKGPIIAELSEEELKSTMDRIVKDGNSPSFFYNFYSAEVLKQLINGLAERLRSTLTENLLPSLPPETINLIKTNTSTSLDGQ